MKKIILINVPDIEKETEKLNDYLKSIVWDFYTDGCQQTELRVDPEECVLLTQLVWPLKQVLRTERLPVFMGRGNNRVILYRV